MPLDPKLVALAKAIASRHGLDPALVCAVIEQESAWNPYSYRYEPAFQRRYVDPLPNLSDTERWGRSTSWGLMQVMGQVAREHNFRERWFTKLCEPEVGIDVGCQVLKGKLKRARWIENLGLLYWNGGGNKAYPNEVLARKAKYI